MTYTQEIRELFKACGFRATIYDREPVRETGAIKPMTPRERRLVERFSYPEQGYRRFTAARIGVV